MIDGFTYVACLYTALSSDVFFFKETCFQLNRKLLSTRITCCILSLTGIVRAKDTEINRLSRKSIIE